jgi:sulfate adenylyltransferase
VAAEISRHGGLAVCSPIAPFDETRQQVRAMVEAAGGAFFLIHVATPLEECERRDRKGLYAKARRGEIPEFTGISSPYEEPADADVRVDTTGRTIDDALGDVVAGLREAGYLDLEEASVVEEVESPAGGVEARTLAPQPPNRPLRVLFVCTANICRSPYMEVTARNLAGPDATVEFSSAGTHGFREYPMDAVMAATLTERGLDATGFLSQPLTAALIEDADLVLTAEASHRAFILDDHAAAFRKVFTLGQVAEGVRNSPEDLGRDDLLRLLGDRRGASEPRFDVRDPYGRGSDAAEEAAQQIDELLRVVVPALVGSRRI